MESPWLGRSYASTFKPSDNVTLVVYAPDQDRAAVTARLVRAVPELAHETSPRVLIVAAPRGQEARLGQRCQAILTNRNVPPAFRKLPRFKANQVAGLRAHLARVAG